MFNRYLAQLAHEHNLRAEQIIHLGAQACCGPEADAVTEAFENDGEEIWEALGLPETYLELGDQLDEILLQEGRTGFLVQIATPVPQQFYDGGAYSSSWGCYHCHWFYGDTLEQAFNKALKYKQEWLAKRRAKAQEKEAASC